MKFGVLAVLVCVVFLLGCAAPQNQQNVTPAENTLKERQAAPKTEMEKPAESEPFSFSEPFTFVR